MVDFIQAHLVFKIQEKNVAVLLRNLEATGAFVQHEDNPPLKLNSSTKDYVYFNVEVKSTQQIIDRWRDKALRSFK